MLKLIVKRMCGTGSTATSFFLFFDLLKCNCCTFVLCYTVRFNPKRKYFHCCWPQVETIGDAYMVVSGAPEKEGNHAERVCDMALDMVEAIKDLKDPSTGM